MVGYVYSADENLGYNCILIKSYDCDDMSFVNESTTFQVYRVSRADCPVVQPCSDIPDGSRHLGYKNITEICGQLFRSEYKADYPVSLSWSITPSGACEIKSKEDYSLIWPLTPYHISTDKGYINITDVLFDAPPLYLKSTFVADVINEAAYCVGICIGDAVTVIGDELYCRFSGAHVLKTLFKDCTLWKTCLKFSKDKDKTVKNIKRRRVLKTIKELSSIMVPEQKFDSRELCNIKSECIYGVIYALEFCLENNCSVNEFIDKLKDVFDIAFNKLDFQKENFVFYSGGKNSSDMNYLTFNDFLMTFAFGEFKREMADKIKINRQRKHILKELEVPKVIYKGKLYFKY